MQVSASQSPSKFFDRMTAGELAVGTIVLSPGVEYVEILGYAGLDFVVIDLMATSVDWAEAAHQIRAASRFGVTPFIRVPAYPREHDVSIDTGLAIAVARAIAIGAHGALGSVSTAPAVAALIAPAEDAHARPYLDISAPTKTDAQLDYVRAQPAPLVMPLLETRTAIDNLREIMDVPNLRAVMIGMGDLSKALGTPGDGRSAVVREALAEVTKRAAERKVLVLANVLTYLPGSETPEAVAANAAFLRSSGVDGVWLPRPPVVLHHAYSKMLGLLSVELANQDA